MSFSGVTASGRDWGTLGSGAGPSSNAGWRAGDLEGLLDLGVRDGAVSEIVESLARLMGFATPDVPGVVGKRGPGPRRHRDLLLEQGVLAGRPFGNEGLPPLRDESSDRPQEREDGEGHPHLTEHGIDILDLLGLYEARPYRVVLFPDLIEECAGRLCVDARDLTEVVLVHELAHAVTHRGRDLDEADWAAFDVAPAADVELYAQLYTAKHLEKRGPAGALAAMKRLAVRQRRIYATYLDIVDEPLEAHRKRLREARGRSVEEIMAARAAAALRARRNAWRDRVLGVTTRSCTSSWGRARVVYDQTFLAWRIPGLRGPNCVRPVVEGSIVEVDAASGFVIETDDGRRVAIAWEGIEEFDEL